MGYGKPAQFNTCDAQSFKKAIDMTDDELAVLLGQPYPSKIRYLVPCNGWYALPGR